MTTSYITDHAAVERALITWMETYGGVGSGKVHWLNQTGHRPALPFATLFTIADPIADGIDGEFQNFDANTNRLDKLTYGSRRMTLQATIYSVPETVAGGPGARHLLNAAIASLRSQVVKDQLKAVGLSFFQMLSGARVVDEQLGQRWERRAQADFEFGYTSLFVDNPTSNDAENWIETVSEISEDAGSLTVQE